MNSNHVTDDDRELIQEYQIPNRRLLEILNAQSKTIFQLEAEVHDLKLKLKRAGEAFELLGSL